MFRPPSPLMAANKWQFSVRGWEQAAATIAGILIRLHTDKMVGYV